MGRITTATYSVRGWVPTVTSPLDLTTTYAYNNTGQTTSFAQNGQSGGGPELLNYGYNADEELTTAEDALGNFTTYGYDGLGNEVSVTDPNHNVTTYAYNSTDELTTITNGLGNSTVYGYDPSGNQITVTDALGHTTTTLYDALDRPTTIISATGGITTITYDAAGRETSLTDPDGNVTKWAYDSDDRVTTLTEPNGHAVTYVYDNDGEVTDMTDADGRRTTYSYNADGDETGETWVGSSPSEIITYTYDADNEMTGAKDSFATLTFTYTSGGQVQTAGTTGPGTGQPSVLLSYTYDPAGSETTITDNLTSAGITSVTYDADERVSEVATSYGGTAGPQVAYGYDSGGRLTSADRTIGGSGDSVNTTYGYDAANRQTTITDALYVPPVGSGGGTTTPIATYVYGYDSANRVTTMVDAEGTYTYTYDNANELTNVDENGTQVESYSYDLNGNRTGTGHSTTVMNETATSPGCDLCLRQRRQHDLGEKRHHNHDIHL
jgi:YD repeat-containing protein